MAGFNSDKPLWGDHCWTGARLPGTGGRAGLDVIAALDGATPVARSRRRFKVGLDEGVADTEVFALEVECDGEPRLWRVEMADYGGSKLVWCSDWARPA